MPSDVLRERIQEDRIPYNIWVKKMKDMGFEMEKIRQGVYTRSEPMKQLEADIQTSGTMP